MNKKAKKYLAGFLCVILLLSMAVIPASAGGIIGNEQISTSIMNEQSVRAVVNNYFSQRLEFLKGNTTDITVVNRDMLSDEQQHKIRMEEQDITILNSQIVFESISCWSTMALATVTETVSYLKNGFSVNETVSHDLTMSLGLNDKIVIQSDLYCDTVSEFSSASYISPEDRAVAATNAAGSGSCVATVAFNEKNTGRVDGDVKYRKWCEVTYGKTGNVKDDWCAMFVIWCAYHANVSTSIIPVYYNVPAMKGFYVNGQKYHPKAGYSPKAGDLIFINHLEENSNTPTHIGIVYSAPSSPSVVWIVDGNWGDKVCYRQLSLNDTSIVGYASPGYVNSSHTPTIWAGNDLYHWKNCYNCGSRRTENESHTPVSTWLSDHSYHWHVCSICGLGQIGKASHNIIEDPGTGWKACSVCGFDGPPYN